MKAKVYFSKTISPEKIVELYKMNGRELFGKVAAKVHSGEKGNQNFIKPEFWKPIIDLLNATVVECNTTYDGERNTSVKHLNLLKEHGWFKYFKVDLMDEKGPDHEINIADGIAIKKNYVGKNLLNYDSLIVLSHFKGHPMGGYGGALKQLSIGCASSYGKAYIHGAGDPSKLWTQEQNLFLESMADAAYSVHSLFKDKVVYVNVLKNMSVDCDCCAVAEDPCMKDIGVLVSNDPIAIDKASLDLVKLSEDEGKEHLFDRINSRNGAYLLAAAFPHNFGTDEYELIVVE